MSETFKAAIFQKMEVPPPDQHSTKPPPAAAAEDAAVAVAEELQRKISTITGSEIIKMGAAAAPTDPDETECSSSFAGTSSTKNEDSSNALSDAEVESQFYGEDDGLFDGFSDNFPLRKKRLRDHWRNFIRPLMWRCKWAELKIKQFQSQALKYSRGTTIDNGTKLLALDKFTLDDAGSRSLAFNPQSHRRKAMKRRKRKRIEDTTDPKSYMLDHILFSYCETKKPDPDITSMAVDFGNTVGTEHNSTSHEEFNINNDWSFREDKDDVLVLILQKIGTVQSRVHKLKAQLDLVMSNNAGKFSSSENLSHLVPCDLQTNSDPSPTFSTCNGETISVGGMYALTRHMSEYDLGDLVMHESAVSSYGEAIPIPDIIESTVGLLSCTLVTQHQSQIGDSCENIVDNILIHNQTAEAEGHTFRQNDHADEPTVKHEEQEKSGEEESTNPAMESDTAIKPTVVLSQEQYIPKPCLAPDFQIPKNKRKRGERKAGTGGWSRQYPGEPESQ